ncbi:MAG TPA: RNA polymerase sigma factor [Vicinamibacterales bacterium]|nr:RNA polymerase sigma factor [Vicinamibacterales bacterium]
MYLSQDAEDAALVGRVLAGDAAAFEVLVERYQRPLFNVAVRMLGSREDAADATQNALIRVYENLRAFDPGRRFFSWSYRILVNECLNVLRARRVTVDADDALMAPIAFDQVAAAERRAAVQRALMDLAPELRAVIVLRHYAGLSYEQIAEALGGVPVKTVKSRLYTARQRLGRTLLGWREES